MKISLPEVKKKADFVQFTGGLDTVTPAILIKPGKLRRAVNFEEDINQGYQTITGYERFDGRPSPSQQRYQLLDFQTPGSVAIGDTIVGQDSNATAVVLDIKDTFFVVTKLTGTFTDELTVDGSAYILSTTTATVPLAKDRAIYLSLAADNYRQDITEVTGTGNVLGVAQYLGEVYAFRNSDTVVGMNRATVSGWETVILGYEVYYDTGSGTEPAIGATIVQGTVSGVLKAITIESGNFAAGTAAGRLIFGEITTGPFTAAAFTSGITANCVSQNEITFPNQDGRFTFTIANFKGQFASSKLYGADGVNRAFEFDGETLVPINTGLGANDKPKYPVAFQNYLFLAIGSSVIYSTLGDPLNWDAAVGDAGEIALGDIVTGLSVQPGTGQSPALVIYCRNSTRVLYGTDASTFQLVTFNAETGAIPYTIQRMWQTIALDDRGLTALSVAQDFGNFTEGSISRLVQNFLSQRRNTATDSHISRDKQQYRLFFSDGTGAYWVLGSKINSMMPMLFPNPVLCSSSEEKYGGGNELIYFGSSNGFVYQMEMGTSFDGEDILAYMDFAFNHSNAIRYLKKYQKITLEMNGYNYNEFKCAATFDYGSFLSAQPDFLTEQSTNLASYNWDSPNMQWDYFIWDGQSLRSIVVDTPGHGENMGLSIVINGNYFAPIRFSGALIEYAILRKLR